MNCSIIKEFCIENNIEFRLHEPMSNYTSLRIGGIADIAIFPNEDNIPEIIKILNQSNIPYITVGNGTNLLVLDGGIEGAVIFTKKMDKILNIIDNGKITVQSGCNLQKIINKCIELGFSGAEGLVGIPGSLGGAIAGNAGSFGCEIKDILNSINIISAEGNKKILSASDISFSYRCSNIPSDSIITSAKLSFKVDDPILVSKRTREYHKEKKQRQPLSQASAGCVFKNPKGLSAGRLIDEAGCKGMRVGGIEVSSLHANYFINNGAGTADDFLKLMDIVSKVVKDRFNIILEPEIEIKGRH